MTVIDRPSPPGDADADADAGTDADAAAAAGTGAGDPAAHGEAGMRRHLPPGLLLPGLVVLLGAVVVLAAGHGAVAIPADQVVGSVLHRLGLDLGTVPDGLGQNVLWDIRFPRVALAVVVGGALACAGACLQGSFGNPLAEPGVVGVSSGAALGAVLSIVVGATFLGTWSLAGAAFAGGLATVVIVYLAARANGRTEVVTLLLTGIAVNAMTGAAIGLASYLSTDAQLRSITFWTLGSVAQATWSKVAVVGPLAAIGITVVAVHARELDLLALGERSARHLGVDVERLRVTMLVCVAVLTAAAVSVSGIILFVGLAVPHVVRMVAGPSHRAVIPAAVLLGAATLVGCDLLARTIAAPAEIPLGVLTSLVGSPIFFALLRRTRRQQGGWA